MTVFYNVTATRKMARPSLLDSVKEQYAALPFDDAKNIILSEIMPHLTLTTNLVYMVNGIMPHLTLPRLGLADAVNGACCT